MLYSLLLDILWIVLLVLVYRDSPYVQQLWVYPGREEFLAAPPCEDAEPGLI